MWRLRAVDDRGGPVRLYRTGFLPLHRAGEHDVPPETWARARHEVQRLGWTASGSMKGVPLEGWMSMLTFALIPGGSVLVVMSVAQATGTHAMLPIYAPLMGAFALLVWWKRRCGFFELRPRVIIRGMLSELLCPACGYSLRFAPTADDGCRVCSECGAAWRLDGTAA